VLKDRASRIKLLIAVLQLILMKLNVQVQDIASPIYVDELLRPESIGLN